MATALMKDQLDANAVAKITALVEQVLPNFDGVGFQRHATMGLNELELKQRVEQISEQLHQHLAVSYEEAATALLDLPIPDPATADLGEFTFWPILDYVAKHGLASPELSLATLKKLTHYFTAEFAIRPYIEKHEHLALQTLLLWTEDESEHVRRLASEGIRPRLPWGKYLTRFIDDPTPLLPVLNQLKDDDSLYVRRSVANNLNDIAKDHPDKVITWCQDWLQDITAERQWLIKHGLRTLVKQGHPDVFPLLGFTAEPKITTQLALSSTELTLGESIEFNVSLTSLSEQVQQFVVDYKIAFMKSNGQYSHKVFKGKNIQILPKENYLWQKKHVIKPVTTRTYYSGMHSVSLLINGQTMGEPMAFYLKV